MYIKNSFMLLLILAVCTLNKASQLHLEAHAVPLVHQQDTDGKTPLIRAVIQGDVASVRDLLKMQSCVNLQDATGYSAFMYACEGGNAEIIDLLLTKEALGNRQFPPIHGSWQIILAVASKKTATLQLLLRLKDTNKLYLDPAKMGAALQLALEMGNADAVTLLFKNSFNLTLRLIEKGNTPAIRLHLQDLVRLSLCCADAACSRINGAAQPSEIAAAIFATGEEVPRAAASSVSAAGNPVASVCSVSASASSQIRTEGDGRTILQGALERGNISAVKLLLNHGFTLILKSLTMGNTGKAKLLVNDLFKLILQCAYAECSRISTPVQTSQLAAQPTTAILATGGTVPRVRTTAVAAAVNPAVASVLSASASASSLSQATQMRINQQPMAPVSVALNSKSAASNGFDTVKLKRVEGTPVAPAAAQPRLVSAVPTTSSAASISSSTQATATAANSMEEEAPLDVSVFFEADKILKKKG